VTQPNFDKTAQALTPEIHAENIFFDLRTGASLRSGLSSGA
jgi:hypothetical protein